MSSAGDHGQAWGSTTGDHAQDGSHRAEQAIHDALAGLDGLEQVPTAEHVGRFDAVHTALTDALSSAENLMNSSDDNGS